MVRAGRTASGSWEPRRSPPFARSSSRSRDATAANTTAGRRRRSRRHRPGVKAAEMTVAGTLGTCSSVESRQRCRLRRMRSRVGTQPIVRPGPAPRPRNADRAAVPGRNRAGDLRHGLLLGCRAHVLARARHLHDRGRLLGRVHAEPDLPGGLHRAHRAQRGRSRGLRHVEDELRSDAPHLLGGTRPDPGHAPGQRRRHAVPLGHLLDDRRPSATVRSPRATCSRRSCRARATAPSRRRSSRQARSTTPRTTTSSTSRRTRTATAVSAAPASRARSELQATA